MQRNRYPRDLAVQRHLLERVLAVRRPGRVAVHLAAQVSELDERRQLALSGGADLVRALAQLGRDGRVAEERVQLVLARVRHDLPALDLRDPVLRDRQPAPLGVLAQRDVVVLRAREVLEHVSVALGRHHAKIEAQAVVADDRRLRVSARHDLRHPVAVAERGDQGRRIDRRRDEVEVADGLAATPDAARLRHGDRRRMRGELGDDAAHRRERLAEEPALFRLVADTRLERLEDLLLAARAHSGEVAQPALRGSALQPVERGDAELRPDPRRRLRADAGKAEEIDDTRRYQAAALRERVHLAVLDDLDDLVLDRLPDARELLRLSIERELGDRQRGLADPPRRAPVGDHLERLLLEDLREVREQVELVGELVVAGQRLRHPAMIRRCLARSCASPRTTSARTSRR